MDETASGFFLGGGVSLLSVMNFRPRSVQHIIGIVKALMKICGSKPRVVAQSCCFMSISRTVD